jgi:hypothetical protein
VNWNLWRKAETLFSVPKYMDIKEQEGEKKHRNTEHPSDKHIYEEF